VTNTSYGGTIDYSSDPILPAWYVPGWSAQNMESTQYSIPAPSEAFPYSNLPQTLNYVNVTGNYNDGMGNDLGGYLTFEQSADLLLTDTSTSPTTYYRIPKREVGLIPTNNILGWNAEGSGRVYLQWGVLNVYLLATDTPNITILEPYWKTQQAGYVAPTSWVYHVKEYMYRGMRYDIEVPTADDSSAVDINSLIVANTYEPNNDWDRGF
jgi:hypothetical protein